jgi:hypothetical protein
MAVAVLAACGPCRYQDREGTGIHNATTTEVAGGWESTEGSRVVLREDGTALLERLDGQDFDFDDGWRLSGTGTWRLTDKDHGQVVRLALTARTRVDHRSSATATVTDASAPEPPWTYAWSFSVDRDQRDDVRLFFLYGDSDSGNTYLMAREARP